MDATDFAHNSTPIKERLEASTYLENNRADGSVMNDLLLIRTSAFLGEDEVYSDDVKEVDSASMLGSRRRSIGDEFQELVQLAQEFEIEEMAKQGTPTKNLELGKENGVRDLEDHRVSLLSTSKGQHYMTGTNKEGMLQNGTPRTNADAGHQLSRFHDYYSPALVNNTNTLEDETRIPSEREADEHKEPEQLISLRKRESLLSKKSSLNAGDRNTRSGCTVPRPFSFATDRRATFGGRLPDNDAHMHTRPVNRTKSDMHVYKGAQRSASKPNTAQNSPKEVGMKHLEQPISSRLLRPNYENKGAQSVPPSHSNPKVKGNNYTRAVAFSFVSSERVERRRQFNEKLEEKHLVMEQEKTLMLEKTKEEVDSEIRELRKNLIIKANPVPSFYQEGLPPKAELKKIPTTRAVSPKFSKRCGSDGTGNRYCLAAHYDEKCNCRQEGAVGAKAPAVIKGMADGKTRRPKTGTPTKRPVRRSLTEVLGEKPRKARPEGRARSEECEVTCVSAESTPGYPASNGGTYDSPNVVNSLLLRHGSSCSSFGVSDDDVKTGKEEEVHDKNDKTSDWGFSVVSTELGDDEVFIGDVPFDCIEDPAITASHPSIEVDIDDMSHAQKHQGDDCE